MEKLVRKQRKPKIPENPSKTGERSTMSERTPSEKLVNEKNLGQANSYKPITYRTELRRDIRKSHVKLDIVTARLVAAKYRRAITLVCIFRGEMGQCSKTIFFLYSESIFKKHFFKSWTKYWIPKYVLEKWSNLKCCILFEFPKIFWKTWIFKITNEFWNCKHSSIFA
jgi:hypothetical protein